MLKKTVIKMKRMIYNHEFINKKKWFSIVNFKKPTQILLNSYINKLKERERNSREGRKLATRGD
jgi:hypothetical protein